MKTLQFLFRIDFLKQKTSSTTVTLLSKKTQSKQNKNQKNCTNDKTAKNNNKKPKQTPSKNQAKTKKKERILQPQFNKKIIFIVKNLVSPTFYFISVVGGFLYILKY